MSAAEYNIIIDQGADFTLPLVIKDNGVPRDLTGYLGRAELRDGLKASSAIIATFVVTIAVPSSGGIVMTLANATSSAMTAQLGYYDLEIYTAGDADVDRLLYGTGLVRQETTR